MKKTLLALLLVVVAPPPGAASLAGDRLPQSSPDDPRDAPEQELSLNVTVEGLEGELRENVLLHLGGERQPEAGDLTSARIRRLHRNAEERIRRALEPFGHYRPEISADLERDGADWQALYRVDAGEPIPVREVDIRLLGAGGEDPELQAAADRFPLRSGDPLRHAAYEQGKRTLQNLAAERGYLDATMRAHRIALDLEAYEARVVLHFDLGPRYRFGRVDFEQEEFRDEFLERFVPFEPGDVYSTRALLRLQNALTDSDYFRSVEVRSRLDLADSLRVPIQATLIPQPRTRYSAGAGYGTDTGPRGSFQVRLGRLNRSGHRFRGEVRASFIRREATGRYVLPFGDRAGEEVAFAAGYQGEFVENNRSRALLAAVSRSRARGSWRETLSVTLRREWFAAGGVEGQSTLVLPAADWSRIRADDPIRPSRGQRILFEARGTERAIGSGVSFVQGKLEGRLIRSAGAGRFLARLELGSTAVDAFPDLPTSIRFFAGGDRSVRGYGYQTLGPTDERGAPVGGRHLLTGSLEYEHRIGGPFGAAVFWDTGNVFPDLSEPTLEHGAGIGARWRSPVGPVRLDLAAALSRSGLPLRLHFSMGPDL